MTRPQAFTAVFFALLLFLLYQLALVFQPSARDLEQLKANTSGRLNNPNVFKVEMLYFNLGMDWALRDIGWRKFSNETLRSELNKMVETRGSIAHGSGVSVRLATLRRWLNMIEILAPAFETKVARHITRMTGNAPTW